MTDKLAFTSRYAIKKALGAYSPWQGFGVTDSLSGKDYLLFSLSVPAETTVSADDLQMRDYLFSDIPGDGLHTLSIQENGGGLFFLLPWQELVPLKKMLPSMDPAGCLDILRSLAAVFLDCVSTGRFFHNLSIDSIVMSGQSIGILPTAYLVPEAVLDRLEDSSCSPGAGELYDDLSAFGELLVLFSRYLPRERAAACIETADLLRSLSPSSAIRRIKGHME